MRDHIKELRKRISFFPNQKLVEMLMEKRKEYTSEALVIAEDEAARRGGFEVISKHAIKEINTAPESDCINNTIEKLKGLIDKVQLTITEDSNCYNLDFPLAEGADYKLVAAIFKDGGEPQIGAIPTNAYYGRFFWYYPFELADYRSNEEQHEAFREKIEILLTHPTRIINSEGWVGGKFVCEYLHNNEWHQVYTVHYLKGVFKRPKTEVYSSGVIV